MQYLISVHCSLLCEYYEIYYTYDSFSIFTNCVNSVLDISQTESYPEQGVYKDENKTLSLIVRCLPNLMSLDISGTNLAGKGKLYEYV